MWKKWRDILPSGAAKTVAFVFPNIVNGFATFLSFLHSMISKVRWETSVHQAQTCHEINSLDNPKRTGGYPGCFLFIIVYQIVFENCFTLPCFWNRSLISWFYCIFNRFFYNIAGVCSSAYCIYINFLF